MVADVYSAGMQPAAAVLLQVAAEAYVERAQRKHVQLLLRLAWCRWRLDAAAGRVSFLLSC
jgi:hypothetical protein